MHWRAISLAGTDRWLMRIKKVLREYHGNKAMPNPNGSGTAKRRSALSQFDFRVETRWLAPFRQHL